MNHNCTVPCTCPRPAWPKSVAGWKEVYTIAVRPVPAEPGHEPLPALGAGGLYPAARHTRALVCRPAALPPRRGSAGCSARILTLPPTRAASRRFRLGPGGRPGTPQTVLEAACHLSFPTRVRLERRNLDDPRNRRGPDFVPLPLPRFPRRMGACARVPGRQRAGRHDRAGRGGGGTHAAVQPGPAGKRPCIRATGVTPCGRTRRRRAALPWRKTNPFGLEHRFYDLGARNAGPLFCWGGQTVRPGAGQHKGRLWRLPAVLDPPGGQRTPAVRRHAAERDHLRAGPGGRHRHPHLLPGRRTGGHRRALSHAAEINLFDRKGGCPCSPSPSRSCTAALPASAGLTTGRRSAWARAFAALGCRAVVLYPAPGAAAPETECPAPRCQGAVPAGQSLAGQRFLPELAAAAG